MSFYYFWASKKGGKLNPLSKSGWLLNDNFNDTVAAGSVDDTVATPGPGVRDVVTDTNSKISVGSGVLDFATGAAANDGVWRTVQTRAAGRVYVAKITPADANGIISFGFDANQAGALTDSFRMNASSAGLDIIANGGSAFVVGAYAATPYFLAAVMRGTGIHWYIKGGAFTLWTNIYNTTAGTANAYPALTVGNTTTVLTSSFNRIPVKKWLPTPIVYDTFTRGNGAIGATEATGPDSQATPVKTWTGTGATISTNKAIITPTEGGDVVTNGGFADGSSWIATNWTIGGGVVSHSPGTTSSLYQVCLTDKVWYKVVLDVVVNASFVTPKLNSNVLRNIDTTANGKVITGISNGTVFYMSPNTNFDGTLDNIAIYPLSLPTLFSSIQASEANVMAEVILTNTAGTQCGLVLNLDSTTSPANFILVYHDGTNLHVVECVAGTYAAESINTAVAIGAGKLVVSRNGTKLRAYLNDAFIGTEQTMTANTNTLHGLFSTYSGNTFDNFSLFPKKGYSTLDEFIG